MKGEQSCGFLQVSSAIINPIKTCLGNRVCCLSLMHRHTAQKNRPSALLHVHNGSLFVQNELCSPTDQVKRDPPRDPAGLALRHLRLNGANGYVWRGLKAWMSSTRCCGDNEATFTTAALRWQCTMHKAHRRTSSHQFRLCPDFFFPPSSRIICIWFQGCGYFWKLGQLEEVFSAPNECASIRDTSLSIGVTAVGKVLYRGITWTQSVRQKKTYLKVISAYKQLWGDQAAYKSKSGAAFVYILMFTHQIWYSRRWTTLCWDIKTLKCFAFFWLLIMQSLSLCEGDYSRDLTDSYGNLAWK